MAQPEQDRLERLGPHLGVALVGSEELPVLANQAVHLEGLQDRVDEPQMGHGLAGVHAGLPGAVGGLRARRDHLAHPVWSYLDGGLVRWLGETLAAPAREIGHEHLAL